ncbi:MAG: beta-propeller fold lactonase family protein [Polyangiaceae bacterium]
MKRTHRLLALAALASGSTTAIFAACGPTVANTKDVDACELRWALDTNGSFPATRSDSKSLTATAIPVSAAAQSPVQTLSLTLRVGEERQLAVYGDTETPAASCASVPLLSMENAIAVKLAGPDLSTVATVSLQAAKLSDSSPSPAKVVTLTGKAVGSGRYRFAHRGEDAEGTVEVSLEVVGASDGGAPDASTDASADAAADGGAKEAGADGGAKDSGTDATVNDAGTDATMADGGGTDSGTTDSATTDSGTTDSGNVDRVTGFAYAPTVFSPAVMAQWAVHSDGRLTPLSPATVAVDSNPSSLAATPDAKFLYVTDALANTIQQFAIGSNGAVTPLSPATLSTSDYPSGIVVHPNGHYAFVASSDTNTVLSYRIVDDADAGTPGTLVANGSAPTQSSPSGIAVTPDGTHLFVVNSISDSISQYAIAPDGTLSALTPATVAVAELPNRITVTRDGKNAYVTHVDVLNPAVVSQFSIDGMGKLAPLTPATVSVEDTGTVVAVNRAGTSALSVNAGAATVSRFAIGSVDGTLSVLSPSVSLQADASAVALGDVAFDPTGAFAYVVNVTGNVIHPFAVSPTGLTPLSPATVTANPSGGLFLVVANP